ncbi:MAG: hypothetical protein PHQ32_04640 [Firmicutes bacterium]|nr:hypothetical protein [Bacillota bacterium]
MDLINRYIYAVTKSFPSAQRKEIELELKSNIDDMIGRTKAQIFMKKK